MRSILAAKKEYDALCMPGQSFRQFYREMKTKGMYWSVKG